MYIEGKEYRQFRNSIYFVSQDGIIYSTYKQGFIKPLVRKNGCKTYYYIDVYNKELHREQHVLLHRIIYLSWVEDITSDKQINHKNDNSDDNSLQNLYQGNQKDNIQDCIKNKHRVGSIYKLIVFDKIKNKQLTFCPASNFIAYSGHSAKNKGIARMMTRIWFKRRFNVIEYSLIKNNTEYKSVTTKSDECNSVR